MVITAEQIKDVLLKQGFIIWKWGPNEFESKLEVFLKAELCQEIIGLKEECFVAALIKENEARFIRKSKYEDKVEGHQKQLQIERIVFGDDRERIIKDGRLVLFETVLPLNIVVEYLVQKNPGQTV